MPVRSAITTAVFLGAIGSAATAAEAPLAIRAGCLFALDSDAHSHPEYNFVDIAIAHAKLAGIPQKRIINYWSNERILEWARGGGER